MKTVLNFIIFLGLAFMFQHCEEESFGKPTGTRFLFTPNIEQESIQIQNDSRVFVTIAGAEGEMAERHFELKLVEQDGLFISEELNLAPGQYRVTNVAIGTAEERSYRAESAVSFAVRGGIESNINVHLRKVKEKLIRFQLGVLDEDGEYTTATASIRNATGTMEAFAVSAGISTYSFFGDRTASYAIEIVKESYAKYQGEVVYKDSAKEPIIAVLKPAFTFRIFVTEDRNYQSIIEMNTGTINIDFGDGTSQTYTKPEWTDRIFAHVFPSQGYYQISVTGDLDAIYIVQLHDLYDQIDLTHLSSLKVFSPLMTPFGPNVLDLRNNSNLEEIYASGLENLSQILLPESHRIVGFSVDGPNSITTSAIDAIIANLYDNIVSKNIRSGHLYLTLDWSNVPTSLDMIGSPSPDAIEKVYRIHDDYGWQVNPIDFHE